MSTHVDGYSGHGLLVTDNPCNGCYVCNTIASPNFLDDWISTNSNSDVAQNNTKIVTNSLPIYKDHILSQTGEELVQ